MNERVRKKGNNNEKERGTMNTLHGYDEIQLKRSKSKLHDK